jgi:pimeloyl-ACP methyl ester carboxylesterase
MYEKRVKTVHHQIATIEFGDPDTADMTLVFVHGWLDNAASFIELMKALHPMLPNVHLVALDLPGHGLSTHRSDDNYSLFQDYIDDIHQFLAVLSPNKLVLVGHSLGAFVTACYSAAFSENVVALVQIEGFSPLSESASNTVKRLRDGILSRQALRDKRNRSYSSLDEMVGVRAKVNRLQRSEVKPIVERGTEFDDEVWKWRHDSKLKAGSLIRISSEHAQAIMAEISCPHLLILGESGFADLTHQAERELRSTCSATNGRINVEYVPGGHHCHVQQPQLTAELIFALVNKI